MSLRDRIASIRKRLGAGPTYDGAIAAAWEHRRMALKYLQYAEGRLEDFEMAMRVVAEKRPAEPPEDL